MEESCLVSAGMLLLSSSFDWTTEVANVSFGVVIFIVSAAFGVGDS